MQPYIGCFCNSYVYIYKNNNNKKNKAIYGNAVLFFKSSFFVEMNFLNKFVCTIQHVLVAICEYRHRQYNLMQRLYYLWYRIVNIWLYVCEYKWSPRNQNGLTKDKRIPTSNKKFLPGKIKFKER